MAANRFIFYHQISRFQNLICWPAPEGLIIFERQMAELSDRLCLWGFDGQVNCVMNGLNLRHHGYFLCISIVNTAE